MLCLSVQEPSAWLILQRANPDEPKTPLKSIENRDWPLPKSFVVPQRVLIHASLSLYPGVRLGDLQSLMSPIQWLRHREDIQSIFQWGEQFRGQPEKLRSQKYFGHILGSVVITGCVTESDSPWFFGPYGFTLEYPEMLAKPIPYRGKLNFFEVEKGVGEHA